MTESELISGIIQKDENAFRVFYDRFHLMVFRTSMGFVHNQSDAEEIVQDVFVEVYQSMSKYRGESKLSTWLYRITMNKALNYLRSRKRRSFIQLVDSFLGIDRPDEKTDGDLEDKTAAQSNALHRAMNNLPDNQRKVLIMHRYSEMSYKEISEVLSVSVSSVESLMFRAKRNLIKKLNKQP